MEHNLLKFIDTTYPNPRSKNEVPIWFLISCQFVMRLHQTGNYHQLQYLLNAGSILTKFGFNVGAKHIGFNSKNKKNRTTAIHPDTVRKFFKDTKSLDEFHIAGYELGAGNEDELVQAKRLVPDFCRYNSGLMQLLIVDRGYIDSDFINKIKHDYTVDILIPLKNNMDDYRDAVNLAVIKKNGKP